MVAECGVKMKVEFGGQRLPGGGSREIMWALPARTCAADIYRHKSLGGWHTSRGTRVDEETTGNHQFFASARDICSVGALTARDRAPIRRSVWMVEYLNGSDTQSEQRPLNLESFERTKQRLRRDYKSDFVDRGKPETCGVGGSELDGWSGGGHVDPRTGYSPDLMWKLASERQTSNTESETQRLAGVEFRSANVIDERVYNPRLKVARQRAVEQRFAKKAAMAASRSLAASGYGYVPQDRQRSEDFHNLDTDKVTIKTVRSPRRPKQQLAQKPAPKSSAVLCRQPLPVKKVACRDFSEQQRAAERFQRRGLTTGHLLQGLDALLTPRKPNHET